MKRVPYEAASLHHHTTYSYLDGYGTPEQHAKAAADAGLPAQAATEHGNVTSHVRHEQACRQHGIKPLFGAELYTGAVDEETRSRFKWHLTVLAENGVGYRNLLRLVSRGWDTDHFYYEPTVSGEDLAELSEGLIVLSGCSGSKLACDLLGGKGVDPHPADFTAARRTAEKFRDLLGDRYYLEAQAFPELERTRTINENYHRLSKVTGIPLVVTGDVHYPKPEDNEMQVVLHAVDRGGKDNTVEKQARNWGYDIKLTMLQAKKLHKRLALTGLSGPAAEAAVRTSMEIADRCTVTLPKLKDLVFPGDNPSRDTFRAWLNRGWKYRGIHLFPKARRKEYKRRLKYEAELIEAKGFVDYFLVISEGVRWAKNHGIPVGPARGSAAASLVCYLLRITEVDPMLFDNLLFERFIDINRHDLPDIDLDFDDERRSEVRQHFVDLYGEDRVGNIATFTKYKAKNSLDDIARVYNIPKGAVEQVKNMMLERSSGDLRASNTVEDTIAMFPQVKKVFDQYPALYLAQRLEGNLRGMSVHAAGLVVANEPLTNSTATYSRKDSKTGAVRSVLSIDKYDAEYVGALKIDLLGLTTMSVIRLVLEQVGMTLEELYAIPLDLEFVFEGFRRQELTGIFQFDGRAMRSVCKEVMPDNFAEVCDINALARPGPLHSGAAAEYVMYKHGKKKRARMDERVEAITQHTHGQVVYQEQILQVVRTIGNFTWEEAAAIRKLISKKQGEQAFSRMEELFLKGAKKNGVNEVEAVRVWKQLVTAGAYAFNAAHCVSYGMLAYWTMWLKQKYPLEFYAAALAKYDPNTKGFELLQEARKRGFAILPPHPVRSAATWAAEEGGLRAGLVQVSGIGVKMAPAMLEYREAVLPTIGEDKFDWGHYEAVRGIGPAKMQAVRDFVAKRDPFGLFTLEEDMKKARRWLFEHGDENMMPFAQHKTADVPYEAKRGMYHVLIRVKQRNLKDIYELHMSRSGVELDPTTVKEPEYVNYMALLGEDETGLLNVTIHRFGGLWERYKDAVMEMNTETDLLLVSGYKRLEYRRAIYAKQVWVITPEMLEGN